MLGNTYYMLGILCSVYHMHTIMLPYSVLYTTLGVMVSYAMLYTSHHDNELTPFRLGVICRVVSTSTSCAMYGIHALLVVT